MTDTGLVEPDFSQLLYMEAKGIPIGRPPEVMLRNNHAQYIFTWYVPTPPIEAPTTSAGAANSPDLTTTL